MTRAHKQLLSQHRDTLVENMYPDDVLNRLQAKKILTARDTTRIKEKGGIDSQNEILLDILLRKPDRAFEELVASLRETDQDHVANIISPRLFCLICVYIAIGSCLLQATPLKIEEQGLHLAVSAQVIVFLPNAWSSPRRPIAKH